MVSLAREKDLALWGLTLQRAQQEGWILSQHGRRDQKISAPILPLTGIGDNDLLRDIDREETIVV